MSRKQSFTIKQEPEDYMDFSAIFPMIHHFSFPSFAPNNMFGIVPMESQSPKAESSIPALWSIEKLKIDEQYPEGVPDSKPLAHFGVTKEEVIEKFLPKQRQLSHDVMARAEELKDQERNYHEDFIDSMLHKYPVDNTYHPNKARKFSTDQDISSDEMNRRQLTEARKSNNDKSMESRYKKRIERTVNAYSVLHLRERILEYQHRMNLMKEMLLQTNTMDELFEDLSSFEESDIESLSSISD